MPEIGLAQVVGGIADLPFAWQENQHIARQPTGELLVLVDLTQRSEDTLINAQVFLDAVALLVHLGGQRAVPDIDREGPP